MKIECGPLDERKTLEITLPEESDRLGVFVSGGIDSAILYYLICLENRRHGNKHKIVPLSLLRKDGSRYFSRMVIDYIHRILGLPPEYPGMVGDNHLPEDQQVRSGIAQAVFDYNISPVYIGVIVTLPEHMIGWERIPVVETSYLKAPMLDLKKTHVLDIAYQVKQEFLFNITHACDTYQIGRCGRCNACRERAWGFEQLGKVDPGNI